MRINRDVIIQAIITEKESFFNFLDYINDHNSGGEIPKRDYVEFYEKQILGFRINHENNDNLKRVFDLNTMLENGIFSYFPQSGMLAFNSVILELLSFLDTKRSKELFDAQFESMRQSTIEYCKLITKEPLGSEYQNEAVSGFRNLLNEIQSKVKENNIVLNAKVEAFAADYAKHEAGDTTFTIGDLYLKVDNLFQRNVKPFLDFTTTEKIVISGSFAVSMTAIIDYFEDQQHVELAQTLGYRKTAITSYYKDILQTAEVLQVYMVQLGKDKSDYLTIENAYAALIKSLEPLRHGRQKNIKLKPDAPFFQHLTVFDGLASHKNKYSAKLSLTEEGNLDRFEWHLERIESKRVSQKPTKLKPLPGNSYLELDRKVTVAERVYSIAIPKQMNDVVQTLHILLQQHYPDYNLLDFLYALEAWLPKLNTYIQGTNECGRISDHTYYFDYSILKYDREPTNG